MPHPYRVMRRRRIEDRSGTTTVEILTNGRGWRVDVWTPAGQRNGGHWHPLVRRPCDDVDEAEAVFAQHCRAQEWRAQR